MMKIAIGIIGLVAGYLLSKYQLKPYIVTKRGFSLFLADFCKKNELTIWDKNGKLNENDMLLIWDRLN